MKIRRTFRDIHRSFIPIEQPDGSIDYVMRKRDPSLLSQLHERSMMPESTRMQSYLDACAKAPHASSGTKRKWRKCLGLS